MRSRWVELFATLASLLWPATTRTGPLLESRLLGTHFERREAWENSPAEFAIITAYATTGEEWASIENEAADKKLESELRKRGCWLQRLTGYSPVTGHAEPGWAVAMPFEVACDLGLRFQQDAIYYVTGDTLYVTACDERRAPVEVGVFSSRVHVVGFTKR